MVVYRIDDLARESGTTVRTIRGYQDRGLLPRPERRGRANAYGPQHLNRLRQISGLLERGYTLVSIKELLEAYDTGTGLGGVLGLADEMRRPWSDESPARVRRSQLTAYFGGQDDVALADAVALDVLRPVPGSGLGDPADEEFLVPSPQELAVAAELAAAGVPLPAIGDHMREVRGQVEHIAARFMEFTVEHVFARFLDHRPTDAEANEAVVLVRRLRPLAQQTVDAELARAMHMLAVGMAQAHLESGGTIPDGALDLAALPDPPHLSPEPSGTVPPGPSGALPPPPEVPDGSAVRLPEHTLREVVELVGESGAAAFIAAAAEREVRARRMDALAAGRADGHPDHG